MLRFLYAFFFGCFHNKTTFPMTVTTWSPQDGEAHQRTYVACLRCGEEFAYNWQKMKIEGRSRTLPLPAGALVIPIRRAGTMCERLLRTEPPALTRVQAGR